MMGVESDGVRCDTMQKTKGRRGCVAAVPVTPPWSCSGVGVLWHKRPHSITGWLNNLSTSRRGGCLDEPALRRRIGDPLTSPRDLSCKEK